MKKDIKLLVMDVDGTLTDGKIYMGEDGEVFKAFNIKDGCGIHDILPMYSILPIIITARKSKILENRAKELNISNLYQGVRNKLDTLKEIIKNHGCDFEQIAYIGDDIIDLECMKICGLRGCPIDATYEIKEISEFISTKKGGDGAVRDFIEWIIKD
jgi:3-deoxy-D-manno-octulosonate 8-phosphate phosphatase (KDO 8-P phosphatase)